MIIGLVKLLNIVGQCFLISHKLSRLILTFIYFYYIQECVAI